MRALRVIRLFGRVKELRKMITAVSASIFAMMNAFVILVIMLCICKPLVPLPSSISSYFSHRYFCTGSLSPAICPAQRPFRQ